MRYTLLFLLLISTSFAYSQTTLDYVIKIEAEVKSNPAEIKLTWETPPASGTFQIFRKIKGSTSWGNLLVQLNNNITTYTDKTVSVGKHYEYLIYRDGGTQPYGYISAAIEEPAIHNRGTMILLVDNTFSTTCSAEITTLMKDLSADGWEVIRKDFPRSETVANVKSYITSTAKTYPKLQAIYILGHIAVPHSGQLNPDGHTDHIGAWSADVYYGDLDGTWTDNTINDNSSSNSKNHNTPGDGKFDQSTIPSDIELQVGRVDFYDMPAFSKTEDELMKSYLNKAHQYKIGSLTVNKRALIDDNFKSMAEAFAGNGWRNFSGLVGIKNVTEKDLISTLNTDFYQWAYGCGAGKYTECKNVGTTADFAANSIKSIFTPLFGSYFGDWDYKNNLLRAPLCASDPSLASFWAGRPNWFLHHMALGENIGYSTRLSQNNSATYRTPLPQLARIVCTALMGDPSLRTDYMKMVPSISLSTSKDAGAIINWTASPEAGVVGYYVYRSTSEFGEYKIRSLLVNGTSFIDSSGNDTTYWYMVRASKLQQTPSGSYYNLSLGTSKSASFQYPYIDVQVKDIAAVNDIQLYPNPARESVTLAINSNKSAAIDVLITNLQGRTIWATHADLNTGNNMVRLDVSSFPPGMYTVIIHSGDQIKQIKFTKN